MITASIFGRLGQEPAISRTKNDKPMCRVSVVVDVAGHNATDDESLWVTVMCFNRVADDLALCRKGETLSAMGRLSRGHYTGKDGTGRESWTLLADAIISVRSARPPGRKPGKAQSDGAPFDDAISF